MSVLVALVGELNKITLETDMYVEIGEHLALAFVNILTKSYIQGFPRHTYSSVWFERLEQSCIYMNTVQRVFVA